jgi:DNA helicase-2/ATP-dependent DNA helicase PcrA
MIGMEDGVFPHSRSIEENQIEEERRLAYVGLTRAMRDLTLTYARRRNAYGGAAAHSLRSRFLDELPRELTDQPDRAARGLPDLARPASWSAAAAASAESEGDAPIFRVGDDVVHANLGEGVVTGLRPGGIVVVRFAGESRDRSLMADVAPIRKV